MSILRTVWLLLMLLGGIMEAQAQKGFHIGTTTTLNGSFIVNQNNYETLDEVPAISHSSLAYRYTWGYNLGFAMGYNFNKKIGILTSITYNKGGQHYDDTFHPDPADYPGAYHVTRRIDLSYIQIPVLFKYNFGPYKRKTNIYAMAGPELGVLLKAQEQIWINGSPKEGMQPANQKFRNIDFGIAVGTGVDYYILPQLYIEAGLLGYISVIDINSEYIQSENWFGNNNVKYKKSYNLHPGIDVGIHFLFSKGANNPFHKKEDLQAVPPAPM